MWNLLIGGCAGAVVAALVVASQKVPVPPPNDCARVIRETECAQVAGAIDWRVSEAKTVVARLEADVNAWDPSTAPTSALREKRERLLLLIDALGAVRTEVCGKAITASRP